MTTNYSWANLPTSSPLPLQMLGVALAEGWQDTTAHVPDADCDFTQTFAKGGPLNGLTLSVTWAGEGTFRTITEVKLTTNSDKPVRVELDQKIFDAQNPIVFESGSQDFLEWAADDILRSFTPEPD